MIKTIILGGGNGAQQAIELIKTLKIKSKKINIVGILDDDVSKLGKLICGYKIIDRIYNVNNYSEYNFVWGLGNYKKPDLRLRIVKKYNLKNTQFFTLIHPSATVSCSANIKNGATIYSNVCIANNVIIKEHVGVGMGTLIEHGCILDKGVLTGSGVCIAGNVKIGSNSFLGQNSNIKENINIGKNSIVGMGSVILEDVPDNSTYIGNPGREINNLTK